MSKFYEPIEESVWSDIHKRSNGTTTRKEDDIDHLSIGEFGEYLNSVYNCKDEEDIYVSYDGKDLAICLFSNEFTHYRYLDYDGSKIIVYADVFEMLNCEREVSQKYCVQFFKDRFNNEKASISPNPESEIHMSNTFVVEVLDFILDRVDKPLTKEIVKKKNMNESVWSDIHKRSNGEQVRKEDELSQEAYNNLDGYLYYYAYKIVSEHAKENLDGLCDYLMDAHKNDPDIDSIVQYVKDNWANEVAEWLSGWVEQANYDYMEDMNESVWSDIHKRSNGTQVRKEDEVLTDLEINAINTFTDMYCNHERFKYIQHRIVPPPPSIRKENDYDGLIKYIEDRRDENLFTNVGDYDKIIRYIKKNWEVLDMDKFIKRRIYSPDMMIGKKIVECEGVPGGATPANVGGMGAAYFPGPNGEPGSGDLPSPTGIVYQQVAPFGVFINMKKKKRKKKFRKEDEPCVHSPNSKVYDYVDDFREYVDRTYNNMDKRK